MVVLSVFGMLFALYRFRLAKAIEMEKLRNRIAQDLHDEIGSTLSSISLYSLAMQRSTTNLPPSSMNILDKITDSTTSMMETMNDIVWSIHADNDSLQEVVNRMRAFAVNMIESQSTDAELMEAGLVFNHSEGIELHFDADKNVEQLKLDMLQRKNIYLIFKESVNNAVKYSHCKNLYVKAEHKNGELSMTVADDGQGFDMNADLKAGRRMGGNGMRNMRNRAEEIHANLLLESEVGKGTRMEVRVKA